MRAAAAGTEVVPRDALPGQGGVDAGAQAGHRADPLVARDDREANPARVGEAAVQNLEIGPTDARDVAANDDLAAAEPHPAEPADAPHPDELQPLPATDITEVDPRFLRRQLA